MKNTKFKEIPSVYDYTDYRLFLKDFYKFKKNQARSYSYRVFSRDGGFTSPNILKLVMDGKRNIGHKSLDKFCEALSLSVAQAAYFKALVAYDQCNDAEEKTLMFKYLMKMLPHENQRLLDLEALEYLSHWLHPVLREIFELDSTRSDSHWILRRLTGRCKVSEVNRSLRFLLEHKFLERKSDQDSGFKVLDRVVSSSDEVKSLAVKNYHKACLLQASEMIDDLDVAEREFGALVLSLPDDAITELKEKLKDFRRSIHSWALDQSENRPGDTVVQINFQMYPQFKRSL